MYISLLDEHLPGNELPFTIKAHFAEACRRLSQDSEGVEHDPLVVVEFFVSGLQDRINAGMARAFCAFVAARTLVDV